MPPRTYTLTFGEQAENHVGMQKIGAISDDGFDINDLEEIYDQVTEDGFDCEYYDLTELLPDDALDECDPAAVLVIYNGCELFGVYADELMEEQDDITYDSKAFMYGRVVNKKARHNVCFSEEAQEPDYENKKGRIVSYSDVPLLNTIREALPERFGEKATDMKVEGNYYYNTAVCGIGYHGDSERRRVIGLRLGSEIPICYQWYKDRQTVGDRICIDLHHGDMYIMSEKAAGTDWKRRSVYTLRHAAGCPKFTNV